MGLVSRIPRFALPPAIELDRLGAIVASSTHRVIAFDVFDTLVGRRIVPEHVKVLAADRLTRRLGLKTIDARGLYLLRREVEAELGRRRFEAFREYDFRFVEMVQGVFARLLAQAHLRPTLDKGQFYQVMLACELAVERAVLEPTEPVCAAFQSAQRSGRKVVLISDFYLPAQRVRELLQPSGIVPEPDSVFVSCDLRASKRSGRLYDVVCSRLGVTSAEILMVGDNPRSDGTQARAKGMDAVRVSDVERRAFYRSPGASVVSRRSRNARLRQIMSASRCRPHAALCAAVPALLGFVAKLYTEARHRRLRHLFFLSSEGELLRTMFEVYQDALDLTNAERIEAHHLLLSRRSTYAASLGALDEERFEALARTYGQTSLGDFLRSLGFEDRVIALVAADLELEPGATLDVSDECGVLARLRRSTIFRSQYEAHRLGRRAKLRAYLEQFGVPFEGLPLVLVDVGWKGSIQDFLREALPRHFEILGYYFGLIDVGQPVDAKVGLTFSNVPAPSAYYRTYNENRSLLELLLRSRRGSARDLDKQPDGSMAAVLDEADEPMGQIGIGRLQQEALALFAELCEARNRFVIPSSEWDAFAAAEFARIAFRPWTPEAGALATLTHRENFGRFGTTHFMHEPAPTLGRKWLFCSRLLRAPASALNGTHWPAHSIYLHTNRLGAWTYGAWRRLQDQNSAPSG